jgi:hypothetical protein
MYAVGSMRLRTNLRTGSGIRTLQEEKTALDIRTILRESQVDSNRSVPSSCCPRLISVSVTVLAFLETQRVVTMIPPAMRRIHV